MTNQSSMWASRENTKFRLLLVLYCPPTWLAFFLQLNNTPEIFLVFMFYHFDCKCTCMCRNQLFLEDCCRPITHLKNTAKELFQRNLNNMCKVAKIYTIVHLTLMPSVRCCLKCYRWCWLADFVLFLFVWLSLKNVLNVMSSLFRCSPHLFVVGAKLLEDLQGVYCKNQASLRRLSLWVIDHFKVS